MPSPAGSTKEDLRLLVTSDWNADDGIALRVVADGAEM